MFSFFRRDPESKAKKHVEKALDEAIEGYPDYASSEYEKAASLFVEAEQIDFAIKYYRESAYCALEYEDHVRAARMKLEAGRLLAQDAQYLQAGSLYSEAADHLFRQKKPSESTRALAIAALCHLAARSFDTAVNLFKKSTKRLSGFSGSPGHAHELARIAVGVLCEGDEIPAKEIDDAVRRFKPDEREKTLIEFVVASVRLAQQTEVAIEWAGKPRESVQSRAPLEFELRYDCPVPVRVIDKRFSLSNSLSLVKEPDIDSKISKTGSWLMVINPVLSGDGVLGPIRLTLEGQEVLVNKHSNTLRFDIEPAPSDVDIQLSPADITCGLGDELVFDIELFNEGRGAANNVNVELNLTPGLEISIGSESKSIQFIGVGEKMRLQFYIRAVQVGDQSLVVTAKSADGSVDLERTGIVHVD